MSDHEELFLHIWHCIVCGNQVKILHVLLFANSWRWDIKIVTFTFYNHFLMKYVAILRKIVNHRRMRWSSVNEMSEEALLNSHSLYPRREGWRTCWLGRGWWGQQDPHKWPEINWNRGRVYAEGHRQGVQVKGLLGRNPEIEKRWSRKCMFWGKPHWMIQECSQDIFAASWLITLFHDLFLAILTIHLLR